MCEVSIDGASCVGHGSHRFAAFPRHWLVASIVAVLIACGCSKSDDAVAAAAKAKATAIRQVLEHDRQLNAHVVQKTEAYQHAGLGIEEALDRANDDYSKAQGAIDLTRCPPDFRAAFLRHCQAWHDQRELAAKYAGWTGKLGGVLELASTGRNPSDRFDRAADAVNSTYLEVQRIALNYGVQIGTVDRQ